MTNIRTFIFFSSAILCCWLVASYAYEPNSGTAVNIDTSVKQASSASTETEGSEKNPLSVCSQISLPPWLP